MKIKFTQLFFWGLFLCSFFFNYTKLNAQTCSGIVFRDFNGNGTKETNEPGAAGIIVKAYNAAGIQVGTTATSVVTTGIWSITTGTTAAIRVEFSIPTNTQAQDYTSQGGAVYGSAVQFVAGDASLVNFGINYPSDYSKDTNPLLATPCYVNGSRTDNSTEPVAVLVNALDRGQGVPHPVIANFGEIGAVWGQTYHSTNKKLYLSAFIKRHMDLPPDGLGAIYEIDLTTPTSVGAGTPSLWLDINASTFVNQSNTSVNLGFPADPGAASRGLGIKTAPNRDNWGFANMGRQGIGDIELSEDGQRMYVMDLTNRQVLCIDYATKKLIWQLAVSTPTCLGGSSDIRPWALKEHKGVLYVGAICSGETNQNDAQLHYYVMKCNSLTAATAMTLAVDMGNSLVKQGSAGNWRAWLPAVAPSSVRSLPNGGYFIYTQPIVSDIEFDKDENMIIGVMDKGGHQAGLNNYIPNVTNTNLINNITYGDIAHATFNGSSYTIEAAPWSFFYLTAGIPSPPFDQFSGGLITTNLDDNYMAANISDPFAYDSNGIIWDKTSDGQPQGGSNATAGLEIVVRGDGFGKANGLGDLSLLSKPPSIEIGNRVWYDANKNGIQDANELGIGNVTLELYADFNNDGTPDGAALATTTTATTSGNALGTWYFNETNITDGDPSVVGNQAGLALHKNYLIRIGSANWTSGSGTGQLANLALTTTNATPISGLSNVSDNDATISFAVPTIAYLTGNAGENNHTLDLGFKSLSPDLALTKTVDKTTTTQGSNVLFTLKVKNEGLGNATGVTVHDTLPVGMTFISATPTGVYDANTHLWTIGNINTGDSVTLTMVVNVDSVGVNFNTAEVHSMNETDTDSSPNNGSTTEDDIDRVCVSVPIPLCTSQGKTVILSIQSGLTNIKWYKNNVEIVGQTTNSLIVGQVGDYTFTADETTCPVEGCCPVKIIEGNCAIICKPMICLPVTLVKQ